MMKCNVSGRRGSRRRVAPRSASQASALEDAGRRDRWRLGAVAAAVALWVEPGAVMSQSLSSDDPFLERRQEMVDRQIAARGVEDSRVLAAMESVPRHRFVPDRLAADAYVDSPLPIGDGQTISQPYIVALMTELLDLAGDERVLEIGTGSGYQAAVLAELAGEVYTIEIREELGSEAGRLLEDLGYTNVHVRIGNGYAGWPEEAPFDAVIVTAAPRSVPVTLVTQLAPGGRMVVPVGSGSIQKLELLVKTQEGELVRRDIVPVRFVPMIGATADDQ